MNRLGRRKLLLEAGKSDYPISSILAVVRGIAGIDEGALPLVKRHLDDGEGRTTMNPRDCGGQL
jgi:hypothetical protein